MLNLFFIAFSGFVLFGGDKPLKPDYKKACLNFLAQKAADKYVEKVIALEDSINKWKGASKRKASDEQITRTFKQLDVIDYLQRGLTYDLTDHLKALYLKILHNVDLYHRAKTTEEKSGVAQKLSKVVEEYSAVYYVLLEESQEGHQHKAQVETVRKKLNPNYILEFKNKVSQPKVYEEVHPKQIWEIISSHPEAVIKRLRAERRREIWRTILRTLPSNAVFKMVDRAIDKLPDVQKKRKEFLNLFPENRLSRFADGFLDIVPSINRPAVRKFFRVVEDMNDLALYAYEIYKHAKNSEITMEERLMQLETSNAETDNKFLLTYARIGDVKIIRDSWNQLKEEANKRANKKLFNLMEEVEKERDSIIGNLSVLRNNNIAYLTQRGLDVAITAGVGYLIRLLWNEIFSDDPNADSKDKDTDKDKEKKQEELEDNVNDVLDAMGDKMEKKQK